MYCVIAQVGVDIIDVYGPFENMEKAMKWTFAVDHPNSKVSWYMTELTSPDVLPQAKEHADNVPHHQP